MPAPPTARIELRLRELNQLFNSLDPSPFYDKDIDQDAEDFIVGWAGELPSDRALELIVYLEQPPPIDNPSAAVQEAVQHYFAHKASHARREFSQLMRRGRASLVIGLLFLATCIFISRLFDPGEPATFIVRESMIIVGWVAMWRPLEIFLYDWWPIRAKWRLYRRLSEMPVRVKVRE
jgi:hypothetical protein